MLSVRFEGDLQDVLGQMREFIGLVTGAPPVQSVTPAEQATPKPVATKKVEKIAEPEPTPTANPVEVSLDEVKAMTVRLAKAKGRQTVVDLLKEEFGAQSGSDIKKEDRAKYIAMAQAMLPA